MAKNGLFFISDYRDVACKPGRDPSYWILKRLNENDKFKVYSTANKIIDSNCFKNIEFLTLAYKGKVDIQRPVYNYRIYKSYKAIKEKVETIHHCEKFQVGRGYNLIPILADLKDKSCIIGPMQLPHKVFEDDFLSDTKSFERFSKKFIYSSISTIRHTFKYLFKKTIENADKVIVPDTEVKTKLKRYISSSKIELINYGVELATYQNYRYEANRNNYNIIYAGGALERKGVNYLLEAISAIKNELPVKLHLLASGYKIDEYMRLSKCLGITENVIFHGRLEKHNYLDLLSKSRLLCLPTLSEGYGWTILDALCVGVPVVTTTACRCNDLFENGNIGIRVTPGDAKALAEAISKLFNDFELCKKFSESGLRKREQFDYEKLIPKYIKLYEQYM